MLRFTGWDTTERLNNSIVSVLFRIFGPEASEILAPRPRTDPLQCRAEPYLLDHQEVLLFLEFQETWMRSSAGTAPCWAEGEKLNSGQGKNQNIPDSSQGITAMI